MSSRAFRIIGLAAALVCSGAMPALLSAQATAAAKGASEGSPSRWDIFAGYSYLAPHGTVGTPVADGNTIQASYDAVNLGGLFSGAYYFNRFVGVQAEFGLHEWGDQNGSSNIGTHGNDDGFVTVGGGIIVRFPAGNITPFIHGLVGGADVNGPYFNPAHWGPALTAGGGMDYETPWFNHHLAIRIFQADYEYMHADFGTGLNGGRANIDAARLSAGIVLHAGSIAPPTPVTMACTASPSAVFPGEPVSVTAAAGNLNPKDNVVYTWSGSGVIGNGATASVATEPLAPGSYSVTGTVKEGKTGKEGLKPWQTAQCSASFTVKEFEPPTISCSANPSTIKPGDSSTITCQGVSPQNRPLTYAYSASAGSVTGTGTTAEYSSAGAPTGAVGITGTVSDDKGHSATGNTTVTIEAPPPPPQPHTQALCSINFSTDKTRPTRVDNEAKACLDQVALDLKQQADAKAVVVGQSDDKEKAKTARQEKFAEHHKRTKVMDFAAQRAVNAKEYLVTDQGIDASRISVATVPTDGQTVQNYLVPAGASFSTDITGTTPVDESMVKSEVRKPLAERHHHRKAAANQ
jgi:outer membrane protein OmpA-like peptidoglycan-associated protein